MTGSYFVAFIIIMLLLSCGFVAAKMKEPLITTNQV